MSEHPSRPPLATALSLYEFSIPVLVVAGYYAAKHLQSAYGIQQTTYAFKAPISIFQCIFAVAAGAALWRMSRFAFVFFGTRCGLAVLASFLFFSHANAAAHETGLRFAGYLGPLTVVAASAMFTWWVYQLTAAKSRP